MKYFGLPEQHGMDYQKVFLTLTGLLWLSQVIEGTFSVDCPPPFPNMFASFSKTLQRDKKILDIYEEMRLNDSRNPGCKCPFNFDLHHFNARRCSFHSQIERTCYLTTTTSTTTQATTHASPTTTSQTTAFTTHSTSPQIPSSDTTGKIPHASTPKSAVHTSDTTKYSTVQRTNTRETEVQIITTAYTVIPTTSEEGDVTPGPPVIGDSSLVVTGSEQVTIIVIVVGAAVLIAIVLLGALLCRKQSSAASGVPSHEKILRQKSDCQPISVISSHKSDMFDEPPSPSVTSSNGGGYHRRYVTSGRKWHPTFDTQESEDGSQLSVAGDGKYLLLREDSSSSAYSFTFHYNTLRAIDHPHALTVGGFGETDTDMTLPRTLKKKRIADGDLPTVAETHFNSPHDYIGSQDSIFGNGPAIYASVNENVDGNDNQFKKNGVIPNGHLASDSGRGSSESSPPSMAAEEDRHSMATLDAADIALDHSNGLSNPVFENDPDDLYSVEGDSPKAKSQQSIKKTPPKTLPKSTPPKRKQGDELLDSENLLMFAYENKAMDKSLPRPKKSVSVVLDPPPEFQDREPTVAVVQPSVIKKNGGQSWLHKDTEKKDSETPSHETSPAPSGGTGASDSPLSVGAMVRANGGIPNGHLGDNKSRSFLHNASFPSSQPAGQKPSAHVQPQRQGTRL